MFKLKTTMAPKLFCLTALAMACIGQAQAEKVVWRAKGTVGSVSFVRPLDATDRPAAPVNINDEVTVEIEFDTATAPSQSWSPTISAVDNRLGFNQLKYFMARADGCNSQYAPASIKYRIGAGQLTNLPSVVEQGSILKLKDCNTGTNVDSSAISPFFNFASPGENALIGGFHAGYFSAVGSGEAFSLFIRQTKGPSMSGDYYETSLGYSVEKYLLYPNQATKSAANQNVSLIVSLTSLTPLAATPLPTSSCSNTNALTSTLPILAECKSPFEGIDAIDLTTVDKSRAGLAALGRSTLAYPHISLLVSQSYGAGDVAPFEKRAAAYLTTMKVTSVERVYQEAELIVSLRNAAKALGPLGASMQFTLDLIDYYYKQNKPVATCIMVGSLKTSQTILRPFNRTGIDAMAADTKTLSDLLGCK